MVQIIEEQPSFGQIMARGGGRAVGNFASGLLGQHMENKARSQEDEALKRMGIDLSGVRDPEMRKLLVQGASKKKADESEKFVTGLNVLDQMKQIAARRNIGRGSGLMGFFPGETARDRAEFEQLGKSLIPIVAAGVPIRNQREFDEYKKVITDPSSSLDAIDGAIRGLESIFQQKLEGKGSSEKEGKQKFDPGNKEHQAKAKQLFKKFGDKEKVREALKREFEGL